MNMYSCLFMKTSVQVNCTLKEGVQNHKKYLILHNVALTLYYLMRLNVKSPRGKHASVKALASISAKYNIYG